MSAADRLDEIEARANAATKGPWATYRDGIASPAFVNAPSTAVCEIQSDSFVREPDQGDADGSFIALARTDVPALVAALRAVHQIASDPDTISALEHGAVEFGPNIYEAVSVGDALSYARDALRDIRTAIEEALS